MSAIQDEQEWWRAVERSLALIKSFERGDVEMLEVLYQGVDPISWLVQQSDAVWRLALSDAISRIRELAWQLDGVGGAIAAGFATPEWFEDGRQIIQQIKWELLSLRSK